MLKVDLGGIGQRGEWITVNCDDTLRSAPDFMADITSKAAELDAIFEAGSIDVIRCVHTLEHLESADVMPSLRYWRTFLKPGGKLLIVVPDLGSMALDYVAGNIPFDVFAAVAYVPASRIRGMVTEMHKWGWDEGTLARDLREAGYSDVQSAGDEWWPASWVLDFVDVVHTGLVGDYRVPNLRMLAVAP